MTPESESNQSSDESAARSALMDDAAYQASRAAVSAFVRDVRTALGWTQGDMSEHLGLTKAAISGWELGRSLPSFITMSGLSTRSGVPLPLGSQASMRVRAGGFGHPALLLLSARLVEAERALPAAVVRSMKVPEADLKELAEFMLGLEEMLVLYRDRAQS
jgi:transcriptional regulator with XRE-family HTH domain